MPIQLSQVGDGDPNNVTDDVSYDTTDTKPDTHDQPINDIEEDLKRWKNRRRMAWISLIAILVVTGLMLFIVPEARITKLETVITWFYMSMASIVGAYMGFSTWANVAAKKIGK